MYKVFTISAGLVEAGAQVVDFHVKNAGVTIAAIVVGEQGRGRSVGVLPVDKAPLAPCPNRDPKKRNYSYFDPEKEVWQENCPLCNTKWGEWKRTEIGWERFHPVDQGYVHGVLKYASVGQTRSGRPKLIGADACSDTSRAIVVFRTPIGFRGSNQHLGDRDGNGKHLPFPGEILVTGRIAQGEAGYAGSGDQHIALVPANVVFSTHYSGRLYGRPDAHYYLFDGDKVIAATLKERELVDLF